MILHEAKVMAHLVEKGLARRFGPVPACYGLYETTDADDADREKRIILLLEDVGRPVANPDGNQGSGYLDEDMQ